MRYYERQSCTPKSSKSCTVRITSPVHFFDIIPDRHIRIQSSLWSYVLPIGKIPSFCIRKVFCLIKNTLERYNNSFLSIGDKLYIGQIR